MSHSHLTIKITPTSSWIEARGGWARWQSLCLLMLKWCVTLCSYSVGRLLSSHHLQEALQRNKLSAPPHTEKEKLSPSSDLPQFTQLTSDRVNIHTQIYPRPDSALALDDVTSMVPVTSHPRAHPCSCLLSQPVHVYISSTVGKAISSTWTLLLSTHLNPKPKTQMCATQHNNHLCQLNSKCKAIQ